MLKIKLSRLGKIGRPYYRIIVKEARSKRDGSYVDLLGTYNPMSSPKMITIDATKYDDWITKGAKPTATVQALYKKASKKHPKPMVKKK